LALNDRFALAIAKICHSKSHSVQCGKIAVEYLHSFVHIFWVHYSEGLLLTNYNPNANPDFQNSGLVPCVLL